MLGTNQTGTEAHLESEGFSSKGVISKGITSNIGFIEAHGFIEALGIEQSSRVKASPAKVLLAKVS